nr:SDR family NAD(P)-dependent oxidoreductase [Thermoanaerobaculia bacterium]
GIGQAVARAFAAEGARVALHYHRGQEAAERLAREFEPSPAGDHLVVAADLADETAVERMYREVFDRFGRLDALVANAGVWPREPVPLARMSLERWHETLALDLDSVFLSCRGYLQHLMDAPRETASIVLVGSTAAIFGEENHADYSAAKAALSYGLTRSLKNEIVRVAPRGRVNCVCPGWVATPMSAEALADPAIVGWATSTMALAKVATPEDIAWAILFLTSDVLAGHLSGTVLPVAGGMEGRRLHTN